MPLKQLAYLLLIIFFSCSKDDGPAAPINNEPAAFQVKEINFQGQKASMEWTAATDADGDVVYYSFYLNSHLQREGLTTTSIALDLEYNTEYSGRIIATDKQGGVREVEFTFQSPTSKIMVIGGSASGKLKALDLHTREVLWEGTSRDHMNTVTDNLVFTGAEKIFAYDLLTGEQVWEADPMQDPYNRIYYHLVSDGDFLFGKYQRSIFRMDLKRQEKLWEYTFLESSNWYAMDRNSIYVTLRGNYELVKLDKTSGEPLWEFELPVANGWKILQTPVILGENLYFSDNYGVIYSVDKSTGRINWERKVSSYSVESSPLIYGEDIVVPLRDQLVSINSTNASLNWSYPFNGEGKHSPFLDSGNIYLPGSSEMICLDAATGQVKWSATMDSPISSSPIVHDGKVYFGSYSTLLYCLDANTGKTEWKYTGEGNLSASPVLVIGNSAEVIYPTFYGNRTSH